jgi:uncharacterized protein (UPF0332 family)
MTVRPIHYNELIDLAYELAGFEAGPGRPRTIKLRRSISTSYYALFHYLGTSAAQLLCGAESATDAQRNRVVRWIAHTDVLTLCEAVLNPRRPVAGVFLQPAEDLRRIANAFVGLQEAREKADYDHQFDVRRAEALEIAHTAADAIERADRLWSAEESSYMLFLKLMVGAVRIAKNR